MKRPLRFSEEAETEALEAARWYDAMRPDLGTEFLASINEAIERLAAQPQASARPEGDSDADVRRVLVRRFPFAVVYIELPDRIQVLAIAHQRRRPGYWKDRVPR